MVTNDSNVLSPSFAGLIVGNELLVFVVTLSRLSDADLTGDIEGLLLDTS